MQLDTPAVGDSVVWNRSRRGIAFKMFGTVEDVDGDRVTASWSATPSGRPVLRHRAPVEQVTVTAKRAEPQQERGRASA